MSKPYPVLAAVILLMIASLACSSFGVGTPDPNAASTSIAQTISARQTQAVSPVVPPTDTGTPTNTFTPAPPTLSPSATLSPTITLTPTQTFIPLSRPLLTVSVDTNCRVGPGIPFERVGILFAGEFIDVIARDPTGTYYYIRNPDSYNEFCWLWGGYAIIYGNPLAVPVFTPPPSPTPVPTFTVSFSGVEGCVVWWVEFELENTGMITFRSISMNVLDKATNTTVSYASNEFTNLNGCDTPDKVGRLDPGNTFRVSSPPFNYDPTGHDMRATITLCSEKELKGACATKVIEFKP